MFACRTKIVTSKTPRTVTTDRKRGSVKAQANNATVEEYALTSGCQLILNTAPGEKYQAPDGSWQTRGAGTPQRDSRCP